MAKQNFLSGGYYGKLGMTVGQRWKNIRTIRSYVIPHNPRTPAQQANRGQFGDCVFFAQVGMQLNYKAPCFEASDKTAWNYRMSVARGLQDLGLTELERFPLYPLNFSVPYQITSANVTEVVDETHVKINVVGNLPEKERVLTMLLLLPGSTDWKERLYVCFGYNSNEDYSSFTFEFPGEILLEPGMQCRFISCDDKDSTTDLIASSQIELEYIPIDEHEFDTTFVSLTRSGKTFTLTLAEPYQNGTNTVTIAGLQAVVNGIKTNVTPPEATLINNNGNFAVVFDCPETENQNLWAFPSGCTIDFSEISSISHTVHATATEKTVAISSDDLTRTYDNRIASVDRSGATFTLTYVTPTPASTSESGTVTVHAVSKGAFIDYVPAAYSATENSVTFTQSYTSNSEILAFPSGATALANLTKIGNGVTYTPYYTSASAVSDINDLTRTYDNSVSSVSRNSATFTFAFANQLPQYSSFSGSLSVRAVKDGAFTTETVASPSLSRTSISFTQSYSKNSEIYAFPSGSTVTPGITLVGSGVTYNPAVTTAQSVSNTDLTRTVSDAPTWSSSDNAFIITLASGATISSASGSVSTTTKNHNQFYQQSATSTLSCGYSSNKIKISSSAFDSNTILLSDDSFALPAGLSVVANGVTYNVAAQTVSVTKSGIQTLSESIYTISGYFNASGMGLNIENTSSGFNFSSKPSNPSVGYPTAEGFEDIDVRERAVTLSNPSLSADTSGLIEIKLDGDFEGSTLDLDNELIMVGEPGTWYISDAQGNKWNLSVQDLSLQPM